MPGRFCASIVLAMGGLVLASSVEAKEQGSRPNILFCIADDWGWPHAGVYADPVVKTPTFDRLAREGVLFEHAYVSSPSCTPSRGAILTGQWHWRLGTGANLFGDFKDRFATYPEMLAKAGYAIGSTGKTWGPGKPETLGRELAGKKYKTFAQFLDGKPKDKPFCFWLGSSDPHRPYKRDSGAESGMDLSQIKLPAAFPDSPEVRGDVADYYFEVQRFDRLVGDALDAIEKAGMTENTIVVMTGDHGMPFPRCKSNLYDCGTRVPLAITWPAKVSGDRVVTDFVSLTDLAPTFLAAAGITPPSDMTGKSLLPILEEKKSGRVEMANNHIIFGKERHVPSQEKPDMGGYPSRAIRTDDFLYIVNYEPKRWPNGTPDYKNAAIPGNWYADTDNGPTKTYMIDNKDKDAEHARLYELSFGKRPTEELYDVRKDPDQLENVASQPRYAVTKAKLAQQLKEELKVSGDPREVGGGERFDEIPYTGGGPKHPSWPKPKKKRKAPKAKATPRT
ncbi:Arylsulfatase [Planctomycetes bacterium Pan216]|uniref:Arylsulfatase n=1 Tax=Kolteria novifilia TaxID=2527975 RepID=A0A518B7M0_9BACT|nr:Arylsulfatase [Planctomycetes bacterium Pan216]